MELLKEQKERAEKVKAQSIETAKHYARCMSSPDGQAVLQQLSTLFMWDNKVPPGVNNSQDLRAYADGQRSVIAYIHEQINFASNH